MKANMLDSAHCTDIVLLVTLKSKEHLIKRIVMIKMASILEKHDLGAAEEEQSRPEHLKNSCEIKKFECEAHFIRCLKGPKRLYSDRTSSESESDFEDVGSISM